MKKLVFSFLVLCMISSTAFGGYWLLAHKDVQTKPADFLCSDFSDCADDQYCAPLNYYEDGRERYISEGGLNISKVLFFDIVDINGLCFEYQQKPSERVADENMKYIVLGKDLEQEGYGICRARNGQEFKNWKGVPSKCDGSEHPYPVMHPPLVNNGRYEPYTNTETYCVSFHPW